MSDGDGERDEFDSVLRGLAAEGETSPSLSGAQIRRRGTARRRRRRVAASAAVTVALVATAAVAAPRLLQSHGPPASPAASAPTAPSLNPSPSPSLTGRATVSLDLGRQRVTVERGGHQLRTVPVSVRSSSTAERLTVVSKSAERSVTAPMLSSGEQYDYRAQWVVELRTDGGAPVLLLEWQFTSRDGLIGVPLAENAQWLYQQLEIGDTITVHHG